ncbi:hypothetical protein V8B97DRAFT_81876 [Scleroderma yunnanense]
MTAERTGAPRIFSEKLIPLNSDAGSPSNTRPCYPAHPQPHPHTPSRPPPIRFTTSTGRSRYVRPRSLRIWNLLKQWSPLLAYGATSLGFLLAIAFWKTEVFDGLDQLSHWLRNGEYFGYAMLFCLIFITTFPPLPLYSTLITLSGYTYGPWIGAAISYSAALSGAIVVFSLSRTFLREPIARWLQSTRGLCRAVRAIERRPSLLFLVRLAPYPYNVLNALLAATPTLEMKTYVICTALSLFKVIVHTSIGAGIRSFSSKQPAPEEDGWSQVWTVGGIVLCVVLLIYLSWVARRAVDDELDDELEATGSASEERVAFLAPESAVDEEAELHPYGRLPLSRPRDNMSEVQLVSPRPLSAR